MIIDCHGHGSLTGRFLLTPKDLVRSLDRYGVDKICISAPVVGAKAEPKAIREANDDVLAAVRLFPDRLMGYCFVHPGYAREAQDEIMRCVADHGMIGIKLYHHYKMNDPVQFPIIERTIALGVPILMHAGYPAAPELRDQQPNLATGDQFADVAARYPEALFICGHIGGGGDWERQLKLLRSAPSVYLDTSGSVADAGMIERCVRELGVKRLLFGCDISMERGLGKILDARLSAAQRDRIFSRNFLAILARRKI